MTLAAVVLAAGLPTIPSLWPKPSALWVSGKKLLFFFSSSSVQLSEQTLALCGVPGTHCARTHTHPNAGRQATLTANQ